MLVQGRTAPPNPAMLGRRMTETTTADAAGPPDGVSPFQAFEVRPELLAAGKKTTPLAASEILSGFVQVAQHGGENFLHHHAGEDQIFFVLQGEATFYTEGNRVAAVLRRNEGMLVPRRTPYWYECTSAENLVIMRFIARAENDEQGIIRHSENMRESIAPQPIAGKRFGD
jgi:mannose-6-phosphate isomerase-like protein (cupin superfamily)